VTFFSEPVLHVPETISLTSTFRDGSAMPARYSADGEGYSPPLQWSGITAAAVSLVLLVEDADAPSPKPLVHGIVANLPARDGCLAEGEMSGERSGHLIGKNSMMRSEYLPPDPPPGHGIHRYVFQIFALDRQPYFGGSPGRGELIAEIQAHGVAKGMLIGTYARH
jgi:hypothetical protein